MEQLSYKYMNDYIYRKKFRIALILILVSDQVWI
jgi:hypothetical protein